MKNLYNKTGIKHSLKDKLWFNFKFPYFVRKMFCITRSVSDYRFQDQFKEHYSRLTELKDKYLGERCFVLGMGPSLDKTRFDLIRNEHFIVANNFYQGMGKFKINPEFWVVADDAVFDIHSKMLLRIDTNLFLTEDATRIFLENKQHYMEGMLKEPIVIRPLGNMDTWKTLSKDLRKGAYGGMVIWSSLQLALHLGFKEVYLLGCDCDLSKGIHFKEANYFGIIKDVWEPVFERYKICRKIFEKEGKKIYNATVGGDLEVFERRNVEELNDNSR